MEKIAGPLGLVSGFGLLLGFVFVVHSPSSAGEGDYSADRSLDVIRREVWVVCDDRTASDGEKVTKQRKEGVLHGGRVSLSWRWR